MEQLGDKLALLNACFNGLAALFLFLGFRAAKKKDVLNHKTWMVAAFATSIIFLISYLTRFALTGVHRYPGVGIMKTLYLSVLGTHTVLAAVTPFLAIRTLWLGWKNQIEKHRKLAKITWPIWMYVSVTGVLVYVLLYHTGA